MKKIQIFFVLFVLCFCLSACDPGHYKFNYDDLLENVIGVELINYTNTEQKRFKSWVPNHFSKLVAFKLDNMAVIETLNNEDISYFLKQLSEVSFLYKYYVFNSPKDICMRLIYSNGDFEVISCDYAKNSFCGYIGRYDSNGNVLDFIGSFTGLSAFTALVNNFFETQIP